MTPFFIHLSEIFGLLFYLYYETTLHQTIPILHICLLVIIPFVLPLSYSTSDPAYNSKRNRIPNLCPLPVHPLFLTLNILMEEKNRGRVGEGLELEDRRWTTFPGEGETRLKGYMKETVNLPMEERKENTIPLMDKK